MLIFLLRELARLYVLGVGLRVSRLFCGWTLCHGVFYV